MVSCTVEPYDSGDTSLSYLKAEMVDMHVVGRKVKSLVSDMDEQLPVASDFQIPKSMEHKDTTYRAMLYYNKVENAPIEMKSIRLAHVVKASAEKNALTLATDPVKLISAWKAQNDSYLNLSLGLMTGNAESDESIHKVSVVEDSVKIATDGSKHYYLSLRHDQDNIPEYYTQTVYLSIPIREYAKGDTICIRMNTYSGAQIKETIR